MNLYYFHFDVHLNFYQNFAFISFEDFKDEMYSHSFPLISFEKIHQPKMNFSFPLFNKVVNYSANLYLVINNRLDEFKCLEFKL